MEQRDEVILRTVCILLILVLAFPALFVEVASAAPADTVWVASFRTSDTIERAVDSVVSPDGTRMFVTGSAQDGAVLKTITIALSAATGTVLWSATYQDGGQDEPVAIAVSRDGARVFVTGRGGSVGTQADFVTVAYGTVDGRELWTARYDGTAHKFDEPSCVAVSDTSVVVAGASRTGRDLNDFEAATVSYDPSTGERIWATTISHTNSSDVAGECAFAPDGSAVYVAGLHRTGIFTGVAVTTAYASLSGEMLWQQRYAGRRRSWESAYAIAVSPDGSRVYVAGVTDAKGDEDYLTLAYDSVSGAREWRRIYRADSYDYAFGIAVTPDGSSVIVAGDATGVRAVAYSAGGRQRWEVSWKPGWVQYRSFALAPDGSAGYLSVYRRGPPEQPETAMTVAFDAATGSKMWKREDAGRIPETISTAPDRVYVGATDVEAQDLWAAAFEA